MSDVIHVALLNEGMTVWRPVPARKLADGSYLLERPENYDPDLEDWQFPPGAIVVCEPRATADGTILAAVRLRQKSRRTA
jgi:hypothetical protein